MNISKASILSFIFITLGLLVNPWVLGFLFTRDGHIAELSDRVFVWVFQLSLLFFGSFIFFHRSFLNKKRFVFSFLMLAFIFLSIETGLHCISWVGSLLNRSEVDDERYLLSPYRNESWAKDYFKELHEALDPKQKRPSEEYHGAYVNVDAQGFRKNWNPESLVGKKPKTIYVFGGSTVWGDGARDDYTIPSYLSRQLHHKGRHFSVLNYGKPRSTFKDEIDRLIQLLREGHKPDYVLFYNGYNDVLDLYRSGGSKENRPPEEDLTTIQHLWVGLKGLFQENSMIYSAVINGSALFSLEGVMETYHASKYNDLELQGLAASFIEEYIRSLKFLEILSRAFGFEYICFWQPVTFTEEKLVEEETRVTDPLFDNKPFGKMHKLINDSLSKKYLPHFFNLSDAIKNREKLYYTDWCHLSEEGNGVVATKIFEVFERKLLK